MAKTAKADKRGRPAGSKAEKNDGERMDHQILVTCGAELHAAFNEAAKRTFREKSVIARALFQAFVDGRFDPFDTAKVKATGIHSREQAE